MDSGRDREPAPLSHCSVSKGSRPGLSNPWSGAVWNPACDPVFASGPRHHHCMG